MPLTVVVALPVQVRTMQAMPLQGPELPVPGQTFGIPMPPPLGGAAPQVMPFGQGVLQLSVPPQPSPTTPQYWPPPAGMQLIGLQLGSPQTPACPDPRTWPRLAAAAVEHAAAAIADRAAEARRAYVAGQRHAVRHHAQARGAAGLACRAAAAIHRPAAAVADAAAVLARRLLAGERRAIRADADPDSHIWPVGQPPQSSMPKQPLPMTPQ